MGWSVLRREELEEKQFDVRPGLWLVHSDASLQPAEEPAEHAEGFCGLARKGEGRSEGEPDQKIGPAA